MKKNSLSGHCPVLEISQDHPQLELILRAVNILRNGGVIIYPTDTLYGFGVLINNQHAVEKLYRIKKRQRQKPFSVLINRFSQVEDLCGPLTDYERTICNALFPGKVTLLIKVKKKPDIPALSGLDKIGFRYPQSRLCDDLINHSGIPISSSSVNISEGPNMSEVSEIAAAFSSDVDLILDSGPVNSLKGSTVLDISAVSVKMIREGEVKREELENILKIKIKSRSDIKYTITFICSGNICRSPMAEGILKDRIKNSDFKDLVEVNSAGTLSLPPDGASENAVLVAKEHHIDISIHSSRSISESIIEQANMLICLADNHYQYCNQYYPHHMNKVYLLKMLNRQDEIPNTSIADPIGKDKAFYSAVYDEISEEIDRILPFLFKKMAHFFELR